MIAPEVLYALLTRVIYFLVNCRLFFFLSLFFLFLYNYYIRPKVL